MSRRPGRKRARLWFDIHSWVGLKLSILMSFILVTGTLAVLSAEMDWATHASMRVEPRPESERASWGALYAAAQAAYPDWRIGLLTEPVDPWFAAQAYGHTPQGRTRLIDIDPYSAEVRGDRHWLTFQRFFRNAHRHLMLPTRIGVPLVSSLAILLVVSMVTGLVVYKKPWRGFFTRPRFRNLRIASGDLHRLCGVWSLWFIPVIALTSLFYLAESLGWRAPPFGTVAAARDVPGSLSAAGIDRLADRARRELPGLDIAVMLPPRRAGEPLIFQGYTDGTWLVRPRASYVAFDPADGSVLGSHRSRDAGLHQRISEMADPLHFGYFGGLPTKLVWFAFGGVLSALSITGIMVYGTRIAGRHARHAAVRDAAGVAS